MMHGLRLRTGARGFVVEGPRDCAPTIVMEVRDGADVVGAAYGPLKQSEADSLVRSLARGVDPQGPDLPWVAVARLGRDGVAAAASTMMGSGLFWAFHDGELVVATDPVSAAGSSPQVSAAYVRSFASGDAESAASPFTGVARIPPGRTARWTRASAAPRVSAWCGPEVWGAPTLEGDVAVEVFRTVFDSAVRGLAERAGPLVATVSGGLDSSFVAASLASDAKAPVGCLVYAPLPDAHVTAHEQWDPDETGLVRILADRYPGRMAVEPVVNTAHVRPLAAAARVAARAGVPTFSPANQVWFSAMRSIAVERGTPLLFIGRHGNVAFSFEHHDAAGHYLRQGRVAAVAGLGRNPSGRWSAGTFRTEVLGPLRRRVRSRRVAEPAPFARFGLAGAERVGPLDRAAFLRWLARSLSGLGAASNPAAVEGVLNADPFTSRAVLDVAASITPAEWQRGGISRGFARRAGMGRVPDEIRLRRRRGQQGRDAWYVIRHDRDDYLDRIAAIGEVGGLEHVDHHGLQTYVASWPWGQIDGPPWSEQIVLDRLLGLAEFAKHLVKA